MGKCCGGASQVKYKYQGKERIIGGKQASTIERFSQGANARIKTSAMKRELAKEIAGLKKPSWTEEETAQQTETLLSDKAFNDFMANDGKTLVWNNYFQEVEGGREYRGYWNKDRTTWEGIGEIKFKDGSLYQGQVKNKKMHGKGRMTQSNGDMYQGEWKEGQASGQGIFVDGDGSLYDGPWVKDKQNGVGKEMWQRGKVVYTGDFVDGKKTGNGRFEFDGSHYVGEFVDGQFQGKGKYYFGDTGKIYEGEFLNNNMNGKGVLVWPDQSRYEGEFKNGKMEGHGIKQQAKGDRYVGQFKNDMFDGTGIWYNSVEQTKRQGEWSQGKRVAWLSTPQETHVTGFGTDMNSKPTELRVAERNYRGGKWREDMAKGLTTKYNLPMPPKRNTTTSQMGSTMHVSKIGNLKVMAQ